MNHPEAGDPAVTPAPAAFDALIIGAGPAGSAAATWLAQAGWSVALVEKQDFPRRKVCGECVAASNLPLLHALGIGAAFEAQAGPELRDVRLHGAGQEITAGLPPADNGDMPWGRALGRETLDGLLLERARAAGATVWQPWQVTSLRGSAGDWRCSLKGPVDDTPMRLQAPVLIDAHGSWEGWPGDLVTPAARPRASGERGAGLLAFKAQFLHADLPPGTIHVLALDGGYGGMVVSGGGLCTIACCIRRDHLRVLRSRQPGLSAGEAVDRWLRAQCPAVAQALAGATRQGSWLACGPLATGRQPHAGDPVFRIGNAAGEAHPILGEGMSMALQSAALLCTQLLHDPALRGAPTAEALADCQRRYARDWQRSFGPRMRLAAAFAHAAMRPGASQLLMALLRHWPGLLTAGARWGGKARVAPLPA